MSTPETPPPADTLPKALPVSESNWKDAETKMRLNGTTVHAGSFASASKIKFKQFLLFRALWVRKKDRETWSKTLPGLIKWTKKAETMLKSYKSWQSYLRYFLKGGMEEGNFRVARYWQLEVAKVKSETDTEHGTSLTPGHLPIAYRTRLGGAMKRLNLNQGTPSKSTNIPVYTSPSDKDSNGGDDGEDDEDSDGDQDDDVFIGQDDDSIVESLESSLESVEKLTPGPVELLGVMYPPTKDEQIVNCALIDFLNALTVQFNKAGKWTIHRRALKATFEKSTFEARVDGYLENNNKAEVLVEVKPGSRIAKESAIRIQETAQMVAFIVSDKDEKHPFKGRKKRLHLSQDRHEIYLTVAEYDYEYVRYLKDKDYKPTSKSFMRMQQFGPWDTLIRKDMEKLGPILLGISLMAGAGESLIFQDE
ncbi:hypothetical protein BJX63DRAFT_377390 [Aspergillus granulosus]|uniref:Uncharacterized protein n=1 Tax=Aspergillus granulosus TaxID=176169 RepID=A0ABR4I2C4_9EURO